MQQYARQASSKVLGFVNLERPRSNFQFIEARFSRLDTLRRILSQVRKHGGKTAVVEELATTEEISEEDEDIRALRPDFLGSRTFRLGFFSTASRSRKKLEGTSREAFLGYAIVKENTFRSGRSLKIYESALRPVQYPHSFIKGAPSWDVMIAGTPRAVEAHLYAQQNGITNCCAHVAVKTAAAVFPHGDLSYRKMNEIVGIDLRKRCPGNGLDKREMVEILERAGARCVVADYRVRLRKEKRPPAPFQKYVYGSVESGYPAIISFETTRYRDSYHGIPIVGHTFNSDTWVPSAERFYFRIGPGTRYVPSESWVSMYIGHDDNAGSHYCIPRYYFQLQRPKRAKPRSRRRGQVKSRQRWKPRRECVAHVIATLPNHVLVNPIQAEAIGMDYLLAMREQLNDLQNNDWARRLAEFYDEGLLVLRPILVTADKYLLHLGRVRDWNYHKIRTDFVAGLKKFPSEKLWMIEFSVPELFSANLRKLGEVLIRAERKIGPERDLARFLLARLPGHFALYESGDATRPRFQFFASGAESHVELFECEEE
jgi:hypothetical protein